MIFYALTSAGPLRRCFLGKGFNTYRGAQQKRRGFQHLLRGPADLLGPSGGVETLNYQGAQQILMYQKSMTDRYYCIKLFFRSKTLEKLTQKVLFTCTYNGTQKHVTCEHFENAASRAKTNVIATVHFTNDDVSFYDGPGMLIRKTAKPCVNSTWIHGFVPVKTWLLIACDTAFICNNYCYGWVESRKSSVDSHFTQHRLRRQDR